MFLRVTLLFLILSFMVVKPSFSATLENVGEAPDPSLPIEVLMTYQKYIGKTPDFKSLAKLSPNYINAPDFAKNVMLYQEEQALKKTYSELNTESAIVVFDDFLVDKFDRDTALFSFKDFDFNTRYIYEYNDQLYAVFIHNIDEYKELPIREGTSFYIAGAKINSSHVAAELTLRPINADTTPFQLDDGRMANLILADLVDLKLIRYESGKVFYHEIAAEWKPKSRIDGIVKDILPNAF